MHEGGEGTIRSPSVGPRCGKSGTSIVVEETAGIACLSLLNAAFFPSRLPRMHDYHANVSPGSQVSAGHIERKRSLSLLARLRANKEVRRARVRDAGTSG